jgi:hypothetical protein
MHGVVELKCGCLVCWHLYKRSGRIPFYDGTKLEDGCGESHRDVMRDIQKLIDSSEVETLRGISK